MAQITWQMIERLTEATDVGKLSLQELRRLFQQEEDIRRSRLDSLYEIDPRNGDVVLFVASRHDRPQDTLPATRSAYLRENNCPICHGRTTRIIDVAPLSSGATFINKNLYPVFYPYGGLEKIEHEESNGHGPGPDTQGFSGLHFVQWTSSDHDVDWHNMPLADGVVVMSRLAVLERTLLQPHAGKDRCYVLITKNYGHLVGSSLAHGHQQIALSSVMPPHFRENLRFAERYGQTLASFMLVTNPPQLVVRDYGPAQLLVPYFMRRPYDMMLIVKDPDKHYLHELSAEELTAVAAGWGDATRAITAVMPRRGREVAYNIIGNNGRGSGVIFEFLPYTQEMGSLEHLGLFTSEAQPSAAAAELRELLSGQTYEV